VPKVRPTFPRIRDREIETEFGDSFFYFIFSSVGFERSASGERAGER